MSPRLHGSEYLREDLERNRAVIRPDCDPAFKRLRKTEPICAEENRDGIVNEPCHADQIITLRKQVATLEFRDPMLLINTTHLTLQKRTFNRCAR